MCEPHQVWLLRSECCGRGAPTKVVCAECMKMCCLGGKKSVVKGEKFSRLILLIALTLQIQSGKCRALGGFLQQFAACALTQLETTKCTALLALNLQGQRNQQY